MARTRQSRIYVAEAARSRGTPVCEPVEVERALHPMEELHPAGPGASTSYQGEPMRIEKMVAFYTSRDQAISEPLRQRR